MSNEVKLTRKEQFEMIDILIDSYDMDNLNILFSASANDHNKRVSAQYVTSKITNIEYINKIKSISDITLIKYKQLITVLAECLIVGV